MNSPIPGSHKECIRIVDDIKVVVPASNALLTPFVLKEQGDWFEDEIRFIRRLIKPTMNVVDIGANYGLYALSIAKKAGNGKVWAFEPTGTVAQCLQESITANALSNVQLVQAGLSNRDGTGRLSLNDNPELNSLHETPTEDGDYETIAVKTLDSCADDFSWERLDFIKLDAEGEELRILEGGQATLTRLSPIVMYELTHGDNVNLSLIKKLESYGYESYYLLPGPMVLVPFRNDTEVDPFQLNLFAVKRKSAEELERRELLYTNGGYNGSFTPDTDIAPDLWQHALGKNVFATTFMDVWLNLAEENRGNPFWNEYQSVLNLYTLSISREASFLESVDLLFYCAERIRELRENNDAFPIAIMHTRILFALGKRGEAVNTLRDLLKEATSGKQITLDFPFYPACERYDKISPEGNLSNWLLSSLLEPFVTKGAFSSYFPGKPALGNLNALNELGFCDAGIQRRISLLNSI